VKEKPTGLLKNEVPDFPEGGDEKYRRALFILLAVTSAFRLFYIQAIELAPDEAYYWTWSRNLQWGYYDHPPLVGFLIRIGTAVAGNGEFGVRLIWTAIGFLLTVVLYATGQRMFGGRAGFYAALLMSISLLGSTGAVIVTPDGPQGLFWALAIYFVGGAVESGKARWWYGTGIAFGLGLLSKYTMVLLAPCVFLFLLSTKNGRAWLRRKEPYLALILGLALFSPVIFWNAAHDWVSFKFQLAHGLELKKSAGLKTFGDFWAGQAGVVTPFLFLAALWAMVRGAVQGFRERNPNLLLLFWTSAPVFLFFAYSSLRSKVEANWPALAYFSAVVMLAGIVAGRWAEWRRGKRALAWAMAASSVIVTAIAHLQPLYPVVPISPRKDPTSQLLGWRALGEHIQKAARTAEPGESFFVLASRHQFVGEALFYSRGKIPTYQWDAPLRLNNLSARNSPPAGSTAVYFDEGDNSLPPKIASSFSACERWEPLVIKRKGGPVRTHPFWKCRGFKGVP
jgi:4-amino-4-deoxy-L-arabinose transferase-like glycosyltransferase